MINSAAHAPSYSHLGALLADIFAPEDFDSKYPLGKFDLDDIPATEEILERSAKARSTRRKNLEAIRRNARHLDDLLDIASRRLFLTDRHETSVQFFEQLASQAPVVRRLVERAEAIGTDGRVEDMQVVVNDGNAWVDQVERIREEAEPLHRVAVGNRFHDLYTVHHREFEHRVAQLLNFDGFTVQRWNGGAGDLAADVVASLPAPDGRRVIVQCKHTSNPMTTIGSGVIQQVSGTRQAHDAQLAFVVTTGSFTKPAVTLAKKLDVQLADCDAMLRWMLGGVRLLDLLPLHLTPVASTPSAIPDGAAPPTRQA